MIPILRGALGQGTGDVGVTLSGSLSSPRQASDSSVTPTLSSVDWEFRSDGTVYKQEDTTYTQDQAGVDWYAAGSPPAGSFWIHFEKAATTDDDPDVGDALLTWHSLDSTRTFGFNRTAAGDESAIIIVTIATDSGGSNVVATGYYEAIVSVDAS